MSTNPRPRPSRLRLPHDCRRTPRRHSGIGERRRFPGWRWVAVAFAFPIAGYIGWKVGGRVDAVGALIGAALTGAGLGAVEWWAADGAVGHPAAWIGASAAGYAAGLAQGSTLVG